MHFKHHFEIKPLVPGSSSERPTNMFSKAVEVPIFVKDENGNDVKLDFKKGIAFADNVTKVYETVGIKYKVAQHDDIQNLIIDNIEKHSLHAIVDVDEFADQRGNPGARIHGQIKFPELKFDIGGRNYTYRLAFDNSHNYSSGVRMTVSAIDNKGTLYYISDKVSFYHRHTGGLNISLINKHFSDALKAFQDGLAKKLQDYASTNVNPSKVRDFLEDCLEKKVIPDKYLREIIDSARSNPMTTQFDLYEASCKVLTTGLSQSIDRQREMIEKMDSAISRNTTKLI
jgi:hypothetical protein